MASDVPVWSRTDEGFEYDGVNSLGDGPAIFNQLDDRIPGFQHRKVFNPPRFEMRRAATAIDYPAVQRPYAPLVGDFVKPFPAAHGPPLFALITFIHSGTRIWATGDSLGLANCTRSGPTLDGVPAVGELVRSTAGQWMVRPPQHCPAGHKLAPGRVLVGHSGVIPPDHSPHSGARHMSITSGSPSP